MGLSLSKLLDLGELLKGLREDCLCTLQIVMLGAVAKNVDVVRLQSEQDHVDVIEERRGQADRFLCTIPGPCFDYYAELIAWHCSAIPGAATSDTEKILLIKIKDQIVLCFVEIGESQITVSLTADDFAAWEAFEIAQAIKKLCDDEGKWSWRRLLSLKSRAWPAILP